VVRWARKTHKRRQERAKWRQNKQISKQVERSRQWERVPREDDVHSLKARGTRTHTNTRKHKPKHNKHTHVSGGKEMRRQKCLEAAADKKQAARTRKRATTEKRTE